MNSLCESLGASLHSTQAQATPPCSSAPAILHARVRPLLHARLVQLPRRLAVHPELLQHLRRVRTHRRHRPGRLRGLTTEVDRGGDARDLLDALLQVLLDVFDLERSEESDYGG